MHHKKVLELALLVGALYRPHSMVKSNDHLFRSDRAHQMYSQLSTCKCYVNSKWKNNCLLYYRKNILKMDIWKSFYYFSNKCAINSHIYIHIHTYIHTHRHHSHPHWRNLEIKFSKPFKIFYILLAIWTHLLKNINKHYFMSFQGQWIEIRKYIFFHLLIEYLLLRLP